MHVLFDESKNPVMHCVHLLGLSMHSWQGNAQYSHEDSASSF